MSNWISARYHDLTDRVATSTKSIVPVARSTDEAIRASEVFKIVLPERMAGEGIGLYTNLEDGNSLLIEGVKEDRGLINRWNISNPDRRVKVGDRIIDANNINGNAILLLQEIRSQKRLAITVVRKFSQGFNIVIPYRADGEELGLYLNLEDGDFLMIEGINEGVFNQWNISNPEQCVKVGDRITNINGINGNASLLLDELKSRKSLVIQIQRNDAGPVDTLQGEIDSLQQLSPRFSFSGELADRNEKLNTKVASQYPEELLALKENPETMHLQTDIVRKFSQGFSIVIPYRAAGEELGLYLNLEDGDSLMIEGINEGLINRWNISNPEQCVKVGDRITDINGINGKASLLLDELRSKKNLVIQIEKNVAGRVDILQGEIDSLKQLSSQLSGELADRKEKLNTKVASQSPTELLALKENPETMHLQTDMLFQNSLSGLAQRQPGHIDQQYGEIPAEAPALANMSTSSVGNVRPGRKLAQAIDALRLDERVAALSSRRSVWQRDLNSLLTNSVGHTAAGVNKTTQTPPPLPPPTTTQQSPAAAAAVRGRSAKCNHLAAVESSGEKLAPVQKGSGARVRSAQRMSKHELRQAEKRIMKNIVQVCGEEEVTWCTAV